MDFNLTVDSNASLELIKLIPTILWILVVISIFLYFRSSIRDYILPNLGSVKGFGLEITVAREEINKSFEKMGT